MYSTIEQVKSRLTAIEVENAYAYGKCVCHKTRGYGRITFASFKVEGSLLVAFVYPQVIGSSTLKVHVKYSDIKIVPKTMQWDPQDIFRIKEIDLIGVGLGFGKCDKLGMIPSAYVVRIDTAIDPVTITACVLKTIPSIGLSNLSVLSNPDIESPCIVNGVKCTIIRIRTFCPQLNAYMT